MQKMFLALFLWTNYIVAIELTGNNSALNFQFQQNSQQSG